MSEALELDLSSFDKAVRSVEEAIADLKKTPTNKYIRDASVQRFEYTYELSHKFLRRYLKITEPNAEDIQQMSFPDLIRTGASRGLLNHSWDLWKDFREARNKTSHTYNEKTAMEVVTMIPDFVKEAKYLLSQLIKRSGSQ